MPPYYAKSAEDLPTREDIATRSGLDFIRDMLEGNLAAPPIAETLDYWLEEVEERRVVFRGKPAFKAMNPIGTIHGGWFGTLLDSCMACAVQTTLPKGQGYTTLEYKVNIVRPLFPHSGEVRAIGTVSHAGRRTAVAEGQIVGVEDGKLYATGSTTCMVIDF
ncbi:PaaI family thioesterase [Pontivivens ytuae]|uniref:PaaI family thioesterase n=1 Tax=Pontivivens ytuae TaxID=2789856 RepID=A0A7S9LP60_9RHOB|nr:PaaI family thioesterase [Pontivivens ytuae]QPH52511.1 PaaI family thioesterase [Pontivivens ytuae]